MIYKFIKNPITNGTLSIKNLSLDNIEFIRQIRNNQIDYLRQTKKISKQDQINYFNNYVLRETKRKKPEIILFGLFDYSQLVGYGGFVHISWKDKRTEMSLLFDHTLNINKTIKYYSSFIDIIIEMGFKNYNFNKISTETYAFRPKIIKLLQKKKFILEGCLKKHIKYKNKLIDSYLHAKFYK